jgi:hypothetical protein
MKAASAAKARRNQLYNENENIEIMKWRKS